MELRSTLYMKSDKREYSEGKSIEKSIPEDLPRPVHRSVHSPRMNWLCNLI